MNLFIDIRYVVLAVPLIQQICIRFLLPYTSHDVNMNGSRVLHVGMSNPRVLQHWMASVVHFLQAFVCFNNWTMKDGVLSCALEVIWFVICFICAVIGWVLVVRDKVGRPPGELGVNKSMECVIFPSVLWHCWLVGQQEGHLACKKTGCCFVGGDDLTGALHGL